MLTLKLKVIYNKNTIALPVSPVWIYKHGFIYLLLYQSFTQFLGHAQNDQGLVGVHAKVYRSILFYQREKIEFKDGISPNTVL